MLPFSFLPDAFLGESFSYVPELSQMNSQPKYVNVDRCNMEVMIHFLNLLYKSLWWGETSDLD